MDALDTASHISNFSISSFIFVMILTTQDAFVRHYPIYRRVRNKLAQSALVFAVINMLNIIFLYSKWNLNILGSFYIPLLYCMQVTFLGYALLGLVYTKPKGKCCQLYYLGTLAILFVAHTLSYVIYSNGEMWNGHTFLLFAKTTVGTIFTYATYLYIIMMVLIMAYRTHNETIRYKKELDNYFSDLNDGKHLLYLSYSLFAYFAFVIVEMITTSQLIENIFTIASMFSLCFFTIMTFNLRNSFQKAQLAVHFAESSIKEKEEAIVEVQKEPLMELSSKMHTIITGWMNDPSQPYLKEGITLAEAAAEMNIKPRILTEYLNNNSSINFKTWINTLRIKEVKKTLKEQPDIRCKELAQHCGFTEPSQMYRVFRKIANETLPEFKARLILTPTNESEE